MPDLWTHLVSDRLGDLNLPADERDEVVEEVAAHLREIAEGLEREGAADPAGQALAQISDWPRLARQIRRAKEERMAAMAMETPDRWRIRARTVAWVVSGAVVLGAAGGFLVSRLAPVRYRSDAVIQVVAAQVSSDYVHVSSAPIADRLRDIQMTVLSRTCLEAIITQYNLYAHERASRSVLDVIEQLRASISVQPISLAGGPTSEFSVSYVGSDPVTVMKVTEKLASLFKQESMNLGERRAQGTTVFLESMAEEAGRRLQAQQAKLAKAGLVDRRSQLETQVLEATYVRLLTDLENARMEVSLAGRQIGEQFTLVDAARLPDRPIGPTPAERIGMGALVGFVGGLLFMLTLAFVRLFSTKPPQPVPQTA
jgi:uncharacterized protein involved in exopolysaccharide biosynthesis